MHIECRRWFDEVNGNTYHSVRVFKDGKLILFRPCTYGYDEQCLETAVEMLEEAGRTQREKHPQTNIYIESGRRHIQDTLGASYSIIDVTRKKDL